MVKVNLAEDSEGRTRERSECSKILGSLTREALAYLTNRGYTMRGADASDKFANYVLRRGKEIFNWKFFLEDKPLRAEFEVPDSDIGRDLLGYLNKLKYY